MWGNGTGKGANVDPRLISEAYRLLFTKKSAPSKLDLVSGDKDNEPMLVDYEKQGRKVAVRFYQPVGGGASMDLLSVAGAEFIDFTNPKQSWTIPYPESVTWNSSHRCDSLFIVHDLVPSARQPT